MQISENIIIPIFAAMALLFVISTILAIIAWTRLFQVKKKILQASHAAYHSLLYFRIQDRQEPSALLPYLSSQVKVIFGAIAFNETKFENWFSKDFGFEKALKIRSAALQKDIMRLKTALRAYYGAFAIFVWALIVFVAAMYLTNG